MIKSQVVTEKQSMQVAKRTKPTAVDDSGLGHPLLRTQNVIGNHGLLRLADGTPLLCKLEVGAPDDEYEREADSVADEVMRMPEPAAGMKDEGGRLNRACVSPVRLTATSSGTSGTTVAPEVEAQIQSLRASGGRPLSNSERAFFEPRFGQCFDDVRIHDDSRAARAVQAVDAQSFAVGHDIVLGKEQSVHTSREGLIAHELVHSMQEAEPQARRPSGGTIGVRTHVAASVQAAPNAGTVLRRQTKTGLVYSVPGSTIQQVQPMATGKAAAFSVALDIVTAVLNYFAQKKAVDDANKALEKLWPQICKDVADHPWCKGVLLVFRFCGMKPSPSAPGVTPSPAQFGYLYWQIGESADDARSLIAQGTYFEPALPNDSWQWYDKEVWLDASKVKEK